jgi:tetratricopeptide (TPR) repeat protein
MSNESKRRRVDPPAREAPSVDVDDDVSPGDVLRLLLARFEKQEEKLERVREEHVETRAELTATRTVLTATRRALAELTDVVKYNNPTFDVNEQLASVVFSHVKDVRTRLALSLVSLVWRKASKVASAQSTSAFDIRFEMLEWYKKGARHGNTECEISLGRLYCRGIGVERNVDTALQYFKKAAAKGNAEAQNSIGNCHHQKGRYEEAFNWYTKSAAQGHVNAERNLGVLYEHGRGVTKDISTAIEWYTKAAEKGHVNAVKHLRKLIGLGEEAVSN